MNKDIDREANENIALEVNEVIAGGVYVRRVSHIIMHKTQFCPRSKAGHAKTRRPIIPFRKQLDSFHTLPYRQTYISTPYTAAAATYVCKPRTGNTAEQLLEPESK